MRKTLSVVVTAVAAIAGSMAAAAPAAAESAYGCQWPRVCFYKEYSDVLANQPTAAYQDMYYQTLGSRSRHSYMVYNSRNDDGARLYYQDGSTYCLSPNSLRSHDRSYPGERVVAIHIMNDPGCAS